MTELRISTRGDCVLIDVHVTPRASRSAVCGVHDGRVKVQLDAPPVDGAANKALTSLFAGLLDVKKRDVSLVRGAASRLKTLSVSGTTEAKVRSVLAGLAGGVEG